MRIEYLEYLLYFAETKSVTATAARFYMSVQGMSQALHKVEQEYNVNIFDRSSHALKLTPVGEEFVDYARLLVDRHRELRNFASALDVHKGPRAEPFYLFATPVVMRSLIDPLDAYLLDRLPFSMILREDSLSDIIPVISSNAHANSMAIVSIPAPMTNLDEYVDRFARQGLVYIPLLRPYISILVSSSSPVATRKEIDQRTLSTLPHGMLCDDALFDLVDDFLQWDMLQVVSNNWRLLERRIMETGCAVGIPSMDLVVNPPRSGIAVLKLADETFMPEIGILASAESLKLEPVRHIESLVKEFVTYQAKQLPFKGTYKTLV